MGDHREQQHPDQITDAAAGINQRLHDHKTEYGKGSPADAPADPVQHFPIGNAVKDSPAVRSFDHFQKTQCKMVDEHGHDRDYFQRAAVDLQLSSEYPTVSCHLVHSDLVLSRKAGPGGRFP